MALDPPCSGLALIRGQGHNWQVVGACPILASVLEGWLREYREYNEAWGHRGRWGYGRMPRQAFLDTISLEKEKLLAA